MTKKTPSTPNTWENVKRRREQLLKASSLLYTSQAYREMTESGEYTSEEAGAALERETGLSIEEITSIIPVSTVVSVKDNKGEELLLVGEIENPDARSKLEQTEALSRLETSWQELCADYYEYNCNGALDSNEEERIFRRSTDVGFNPIAEFVSCLKLGHYPRPEILTTMADSFNLYLSKKGALSLDEAFFDAGTQKAGGVLRKYNRDLIYWIYHEAINANNSKARRGGGPKKTTVRIRIEVIARHGLNIKESTLEREYKKWKVRRRHELHRMR